MSSPAPPPSRLKIRLAIAVAVICSGIALAGQGFFWWKDRQASNASLAPKGEKAATFEQMKRTLLEGWGKERSKLDFQRQELSQWVEQAGARLLELEAERARLLDRMKSLLKERNDARQEAGQARAQLESSRKAEAQLNAELERLKKESKAAPAAPAPAVPRQEKPVSAGQVQDFEKQERQKWEAKLNELNAQVIKMRPELGEAQRKLAEVREEAAQRETDLKAKLQAAQQWFAKAQADVQRKLQEAQGQASKGQAHERAALQDLEKERLALEQIRSNIVQDWTRLYIRVGILETEKGNLSQAEAAFRQAIRLSPSSVEAHYNLGILYDDFMRNRVAAISEYEQYLLLSPKAKDAQTVRGWLDVLQAEQVSRSGRDQWNRPGTHGFAKTLKQLLD